MIRRIRSIVQSETPVEDENVLWIDVSNPDRVTFKLFIQDTWVSIDTKVPITNLEELEHFISDYAPMINSAVEDMTDLINNKVSDEALAREQLEMFLQENKADLENGKVPVEQLPELTVADGSVVPGKIASLVLEQDPDWITVFGGEGHWVFADDEHGMNRPEGLPEPGTGETLVYNIITFGMSERSKPTCMVVSPDLEVYFLMLEENNTISISNVVDISILVDQLLLKADVSYVNGKIGDIDAVLDILNGDVEDSIEEVINSMEGV